ncbi:hypothetical protein [Streptomyces sp. NPDC029674]|uniref:hypothetical protein n=1 Tax=Streptomyces sp. NPDC029674 TaxID=3365297 RepID=UPI00384C0221
MHTTENAAQGITPALELGLQELEAMEAPGIGDIASYVGGAAVGGAVTYSVVATVLT